MTGCEMLAVGDMVAYNEDGVCRVEQIGALTIWSAQKDAMYYTLQPISGDGVIYVPVDTQLPLRRAMNREEALELLDSIPYMDAPVCRLGAKRALDEHYRALMLPHTPRAYVRTIKSVYAKRGGSERARALNTTDDYYRKRAEALLFQELAAALGAEQQDIELRIRCILADGI